MVFKTFEQFKKDFNFDLVNEIRVLKRVMQVSNSQGVQLLAKQSLEYISNAHRPKSHIDFYQEIQYISYINCLLDLDINEYFDKIFDILFEYGWKIESLQTIKNELEIF